MKNKSPRQELGDFYGNGELRQAVEDRLSSEATQLLIDIVARYCEPKPTRGPKNISNAFRLK